MTTFLFITKEHQNAEDVRSEPGGWSCSKTAKVGDLALVYLSGIGISYEWQITSNAEDEETWGSTCDVQFLRDIDPPITLKELRDTIPKADWNPPHQNFRGFRAITIPQPIAIRIKALRTAAPSAKLPQAEVVALTFVGRVASSQRLSQSERRTRLSKAPVKPRSLLVQTTVFERNPDVVAEVLARAKGRCESCKAQAPFLRASDGTPYLEVHHRRRLADGGEDTVRNATALCPNCHRQAHFGL